jgi:hypothetical protein
MLWIWCVYQDKIGGRYKPGARIPQSGSENTAFCTVYRFLFVNAVNVLRGFAQFAAN